jgi:hypothetical protein
MNKLHVIYIPGLGDIKPDNQRKIVGFWRHYGVEPELFHMNWGDKEPWEPKFNKLLARIDKLSKDGKVALVGASAGASAVINAYAARQDKIVGAVCISGKIHHPENIGDKYHKNNPSFITSAFEAPKSLEKIGLDNRKHILCRYALFDQVVTDRDSRVAGARNRRSPTVGHVVTIGFQLIFGAPSFLRFLLSLPINTANNLY